MIIRNLVDMSNEALVARFVNAITWEKCDMALTLNADAIKKQETIISSDEATADEIKVAQAKLEALQVECAKIKSQQEEVTDDYTTVLSSISSASNEHTANDETAVRNILRLSCCDDNSKFFKLAILTQETFESFYDSMVQLHDMDSDEINANGLRQYSDKSNAVANALEKDIQGLIKRMFSIQIENDYTKKVNVKFNKTDLACVHETFVTGLSVDMKNSKKTGTTVEGVSFRYAIEKVEKKGKDPEYKGVRFKETLAKLAFNKLFA